MLNISYLDWDVLPWPGDGDGQLGVVRRVDVDLELGLLVHGHQLQVVEGHRDFAWKRGCQKSLNSGSLLRMQAAPNKIWVLSLKPCVPSTD